MLKEVKEYFITPVGNVPSLDDCYKAINLANKNDCFVKMKWHVTHSGTYSKMVDSSDDGKDVYDGLPKVYGV